MVHGWTDYDSIVHGWKICGSKSGVQNSGLKLGFKIWGSKFGVKAWVFKSLGLEFPATKIKGEKFNIEMFSTLDRNKDSLITVEEYIQTFMTIKKNEAATLSKL